jgi:hypothetical protein
MEHLELCRAMAPVADLRSIQATSRGQYLDISELHFIFKGGKNVVSVDWVELEEGTCHIIAVRPRYLPPMFQRCS